MPLTIGTALTPDAEYTCVGVTVAGWVKARVVDTVGMAVELGARPGICSGKHFEAMGLVDLKSGFDHAGTPESPSLAFMLRSTSTSSLLSNLMPVVEGLPEQTPA